MKSSRGLVAIMGVACSLVLAFAASAAADAGPTDTALASYAASVAHDGAGDATSSPLVSLTGLAVNGDTMTVGYHAEGIAAFPEGGYGIQFSWDGCQGGFNREIVAKSGTFDGSFTVTASFVGSNWTIDAFYDDQASTAFLAASLDARLQFPCEPAVNTTSFTIGEVPPAPDALQNTAPPTVVGTPRVGVRLTASPGMWSPSGATFAYQWLADGSAIVGATAATYTPTSGVKGRRISVRATASKVGLASASATSAKTALVAAGIVTNRSLPTIAGTKRVGYRLTASVGSWSPTGLTYRYQWFKGTAAITGATGRTYKLPAGVRGKRIRVRITAARTGYASAARFSAFTVPIK